MEEIANAPDARRIENEEGSSLLNIDTQLIGLEPDTTLMFTVHYTKPFLNIEAVVPPREEVQTINDPITQEHLK